MSVAANVARIRDRIAAAARRAGRDPAAVRLIAVSKTKSAAMIDEAIEAGITDIGENYVQEAAAKRPLVRGAARWHLIGHLQRNKAAKALGLFDVVHTLDRIELARAIDRHAAAAGRIVPAFVEVNIGREPGKSGVLEEQLEPLIAAIRGLPAIRLEGLMAIPPAGDVESVRPYFRQMRELRDRFGLEELSMGMSGDFEAAIEEGATYVRIGRAIFGERGE